MVCFYRTDSGQRVLAALPEITREGMAAGQVWGQGLGARIEARVMGRLRSEGFIK